MTSHDEIKDNIAKLGEKQAWNHNFKFPGNIETNPGKQKLHGKNLVKLSRIQPLLNEIGLENKNFLDVGCNEGFFSHVLAERGSKVLGIDIDSHRIEKANFVLENIGSNLDIEFKEMDIYSKKFKSLPRFDLCLCLGFLHRIPDPYSAIKALVEKTDMIIFEWKVMKLGPHDEAFAYFADLPINKKDKFGTEYWRLSFTALERILVRLGMTFFHRIDDPTQIRGILVASKHNHKLFEKADLIVKKSRIRSFLRHSKRYVKTIFGIISGRINA